MPWCPKCKAEYQEGFKVCADCNVELVDEWTEEMDMVPFTEEDDKAFPEKLVKYFEFSGLKASLTYDEEREIYVVSVPFQKQKQAKQLYQAFLAVESDRIARERTMKMHGPSEDDGTEVDSGEDFETDEYEAAKEMVDESGTDIVSDKAYDEVSENELLDSENELSDSEDGSSEEVSEDTEDEDASLINPREESGVYVMKADRYKDLKDTVIVFLLFGIVGLIVVILNVAHVFNFINGVVAQLVLGLLFLFFIGVGLNTQQKARKIQSEIDDESKLTDKINQWLKVNVTEAFLESIKNDKLSDEVNYLKASEEIRQMLIKEFGDQNPSYLDRLIDEFYSKNFDDNGGDNDDDIE